MLLKKALQKNLSTSRRSGWFLGLGAMTLPLMAHAAAYQLDESSPYWLGMANAGEAAATNDVSSIFVNPANLASIKRKQFYAGGVLIAPKISYSGAEGTMQSDFNPKSPVPGITSESNVSQVTPVPNMAYGMQLTPSISAGISVTAPWGTFIEYNKATVFRNSAVKTSLQTVAVSPALSWKVSDELAIGAALNVMDSRGQYSNYIASLDTDPNAAQFYSDINVQGMGLGWTVGATYKPSSSTVIGASYRSYVNQSLNGTGFIQAYPVSGGMTAGGVASTQLPLPDVWTLGLTQQLTSKLQMGLSARYTRWDRVKTLMANVTMPAGLTFSTSPNWKNTWMLSAGGQYQWNEQLTLRAGVAYDQTPTYDATRDARSPDGSRTWGTLGASWTISKQLSMDVSYAHIWMKNVSISTLENGSMYFFPGQTTPINQQTTAKANYSGSFNEFGVGLRYTF